MINLFSLAERKVSVLLLPGLSHLKNFSKCKRKISNRLLPAPGSSYTKDTMFTLGQLGCFTVRNQSTVENEHVGTSVVNTIFFFFNSKLTIWKKSRNLALHTNIGQYTWYPEGFWGRMLKSRACLFSLNRVFLRDLSWDSIWQAQLVIRNLYLHKLLYTDGASIFNKEERDILVWR